MTAQHAVERARCAVKRQMTVFFQQRIGKTHVVTVVVGDTYTLDALHRYLVGSKPLGYGFRVDTGVNEES